MEGKEFLTSKGVLITLRPLVEADAPALIAIFEKMGPESRYLRFHEHHRQPDPGLVRDAAREIAAMPRDRGRGWIGLVQDAGGETPVGAVRYVYADDGRRAEFALSIADEYQGQGIGTWFVEWAIASARADGLESLFGYVQHENQAMWRLLRRLSVEVETRMEDGEPVVTLFVQQAREPVSKSTAG